MDWCVMPYEKANHHPVAFVNKNGSDAIGQIKAKPGQEIKLDASGSLDPDGDKLSFFWSVYPEAGTYSGCLEIPANQAAVTNIIIPGRCSRNQIISTSPKFYYITGVFT